VNQNDEINYGVIYLKKKIREGRYFYSRYY